MPNLGGFLYDSSGTAINAATINIYARNTVTPVVATTTTNASGYWQSTGIAEGRYDIEIVNGTTTLRLKYDDQVQIEELEAAVFKLRNPADTFAYDLVPGAITAARTLNLPVITGADTLSVLGLAQTYSTVKTFSAIPVMSGGAVGFPATQVASATANDLDDYEEGTWTPGVTFGGAAVGVTYDNQFGYYTKIGNMVHATGMMSLTSNGTSVGAALITGLPFTVANVSGHNVPASLVLSAVTYANMALADAVQNTTTIALREITEAGAQTDLADTDVSDTAVVRVDVTYRV